MDIIDLIYLEVLLILTCKLTKPLQSPPAEGRNASATRNIKVIILLYSFFCTQCNIGIATKYVFLFVSAYIQQCGNVTRRLRISICYAKIINSCKAWIRVGSLLVDLNDKFAGTDHRQGLRAFESRKRHESVRICYARNVDTSRGYWWSLGVWSRF